MTTQTNIQELGVKDGLPTIHVPKDKYLQFERELSEKLIEFEFRFKHLIRLKHQGPRKPH